MAFRTVFDAHQVGLTAWLAPIGLVVAAVFVFASNRMRTRLPFGLGFLFPLAAVIAAIAFAVAPFLQHRLVADDFSKAHYAVVEGPVTAYRRPVPTASGFKPGAFTVQGQTFPIPNYVITIGFDNQDDAIEVGHYVRITHDGLMILRVEILR